MDEKKKMNSMKSYVSTLMLSTALVGGSLILAPIAVPFTSIAHAQSSQVLISKVLFNGNARLKVPVLEATVDSQTGGVVNDNTIQNDIDALKAAYRAKGRNAVNINARIVSLPSGRANVVFDIDEGDKSKISAVNFTGNNAYSAYRLSDVVSTHKTNLLSWLRNDDIYDARRIENDKQLLTQYYVNRGYADFQVISTDVDFVEADNSYIITFNVDEGVRYKFGDIRIESSIEGVDGENVSRLIKTESQDTYNARDVRKSMIAMTEKLSGEGHSFAEVTPRGDRNFDDNTISLTYYIDEGAKAYVDSIEVEGNTRTRDYVIRREFDISEGDAYNKALIANAKDRLEKLGYFKSVKITTRPGSAEDRVIIVVNVEDQPTGELSLGGGYSSSGGALATVSFSEKNFLGRGQHLKLSGSFGQDDRKYEFSFTEPFFLGRRLAAGFDIYRTTSEANSTSSFDRSSFGGKLRVTAPITDDLKASVYYSYDETEIKAGEGVVLTDLSVATQASIGTWVTSSVGGSLVYNTLDNTKLPREGLYARASFQYAGVGGDANYFKATTRASYYHILHEDADLIGMVSIGAGHIESIGDNLRHIDNFFQGSEAVRGFAASGIGPRDLTTGEALGGTTYYNATAELQFPLYGLPRSFGLRGAVFVEAGTLTGNEYSGAVSNATSATFNDDTIRASVGASIIWDSPFGALRADYAHAFSKTSYDKIQEFNFGISSKF
jgi:outer membrane protein insertion porin family